MQKIIKGRLYDTSTAIACGQFVHSSGDGYINETLFRKKTGEFFIHGQGGPWTKYAKAIDQIGWSGGERIMPLGYPQAKEWTEEHLGAEDYQRLFGQIPEDDEKSVINLRINAATAEKLRREASRTGETLTALIEGMIKACCDTPT